MINPEDIRVDVYAPSVSVERWNDEDFGVRITHLPTGIIVNSTGQRSHLLNKAAALEQLERILRERDERISV